MLAHQNGEADEFLHYIDDPVIIARWFHASVGVELVERLGDARLIRDREHAHPSPKDAKCVDAVERLRARRNLHHRQRTTLCRSHSPHVERQVIDLRFHDAGDLAVPLGAARSEEHTSELQSLMRISYAVFCLKKKKQTNIV